MSNAERAAELRRQADELEAGNPVDLKKIVDDLALNVARLTSRLNKVEDRLDQVDSSAK
jgi:hypothetical protein